jgi:hypothetical protein
MTDRNRWNPHDRFGAASALKGENTMEAEPLNLDEMVSEFPIDQQNDVRQAIAQLVAEVESDVALAAKLAEEEEAG